MNTMALLPGGGRTAALTVVTALAPMVWGTTYFVTTELLPAGHPLFAGLMRALPAGIVAVAIGAVAGRAAGRPASRPLPRGSWWWKSAVLGVLNIGLFFPMLFISAERLPGGVAATLGAIGPLVVALLAVPVLGERLSLHRIGWGIAGVAGVGLVVLGPGAGLDAAGVIAGLVGAGSMALGVTLTKRWGRPEGVGPISLAGWQLTAGGLFLVPVTLIAEGMPPAIDGRAALGYVWLGLVGGLIAYVLWFRGIGRLPVTSVAFLVPLSPLVAAVIGVGVLGETLSAVQVVGFALALAAVLAGQLPPRGGRTVRSAAPGVSSTSGASGASVPGGLRGLHDASRCRTAGGRAMRIVVFGATGMVGTRTVQEASARGHEVVAVSRRGQGRGTVAAASLDTVSLDARDQVAVQALLHTADVAISAIRPRPGEEASVPETTSALLDAAAATGTALLLVGGAGPLASPASPTSLVIDDERFVPAQWRSSAAASLAQLQACEGHQAAWTYLSPPAVLEPGVRTGTYRRGTTTLLLDDAGRSRISAEDLAVAVLDEVEDPGDARHFTVAY